MSEELKNKKEKLFDFVVAPPEKKEYLTLNEKDLEILFKYNLINELFDATNSKLYKKYRKEDGSTYYKNVYGDEWKLIENDKLIKVAWGF